MGVGRLSLWLGDYRRESASVCVCVCVCVCRQYFRYQGV